MKKITLLVASILLVGNVAKATDKFLISEEERGTRFNSDEPVSFTERGIEFFVFLNGDFDFNTRPNDSQGNYYYKTAGQKRTIQTADRRPTNYGVIIEHDSFGRVLRVGNVFINYDSRDRVSRIGTVYMRYNRFALTQIGGLQLVYNRFGEVIDTIGYVKGRTNWGYTYSAYATNCTNYSETTSNYDDNYYYYRADGTKERIKDR